MPQDHPFTAGDLIQLPRFDAQGAIAIGEGLLEVARAEGPLPKPIHRAKEGLEAALVIVQSAAAARLAAAEAEDPSVAAEADLAVDACWSGLFEWLSGFAKLPGDAPASIEARALLRELYP